MYLVYVLSSLQFLLFSTTTAKGLDYVFGYRQIELPFVSGELKMNFYYINLHLSIELVSPKSVVIPQQMKNTLSFFP